MAIETPDYNLLKKDQKIEIRDYKKSDLNIYITTTQFLRSKVQSLRSK